jgi:hypothetical protein
MYFYFPFILPSFFFFISHPHFSFFPFFHSLYLFSLPFYFYSLPLLSFPFFILIPPFISLSLYFSFNFSSSFPFLSLFVSSFSFHFLFSYSLFSLPFCILLWPLFIPWFHFHFSFPLCSFPIPSSHFTSLFSLLFRSDTELQSSCYSMACVLHNDICAKHYVSCFVKCMHTCTENKQRSIDISLMTRDVLSCPGGATIANPRYSTFLPESYLPFYCSANYPQYEWQHSICKMT